MRTLDSGRVAEALHRYFLLNYREEAIQRKPMMWDLFPLALASRLDMVLVNGGHTAHFFFSRPQTREHVAFIHHVEVAGAGGDAAAETAFLAHQFDGPDTLLHFVLEAPLVGQFDQVDDEARAAAAEHARLVRPSA
jgi:hypothetical protein